MCLDNQGLTSVFLYDVYYCYAFHLFDLSTNVEICIVCKVCNVFIACFKKITKKCCKYIQTDHSTALC